MSSFIRSRNPLGALFTLEPYSSAVLYQVVIDVFDLYDRSAVKRRAFDSISSALHRMFYLFSELKLIITHFTEKFDLQDFLLNEAVNLHAVRYPDPAGRTV